MHPPTFPPRHILTRYGTVTKGFPSLAISNQPDGSFATRDLFVFHPTLKDRLKYVGRLDDTLTQTLGEKTNPVPIELTIRGASEYVSQGALFSCRSS